MTRDRLYLDMMQSVLGSTSKVLIDQKGGNNLLYLPLDKLMQQGARRGRRQPGHRRVRRRAQPSRPTSRPRVTPDTSRTLREGLRSREREAAR